LAHPCNAANAWRAENTQPPKYRSRVDFAARRRAATRSARTPVLCAQSSGRATGSNTIFFANRTQALGTAPLFSPTVCRISVELREDSERHFFGIPPDLWVFYLLFYPSHVCHCIDSMPKALSIPVLWRCLSRLASSPVGSRGGQCAILCTDSFLEGNSEASDRCSAVAPARSEGHARLLRPTW